MHTAGVDGFARHAEHHATGLVLRQVIGTRLAHFIHCHCAILAHAGEHDAEDRRAGHQCSRAEQHLDRRAVMIDRRLVGERGLVVRAIFDQLQMAATGGDIGVAGQHPLAVFRLLHADPAQFVETLGKAFGKAGRHVLGDQNAGCVGRQGGEHFPDRFSAAGGGADQDQFFGAGQGQARHCRTRRGRRCAKCARRSSRRSTRRTRRSARCGCGRSVYTEPCHGRRTDFAGQPIRVFEQALLDAELGLGHEIDCPKFERTQGGVGPGFGEG